MNTTTITIDVKVKQILDNLKHARRESYNDVLNRVLPIAKKETDVEALQETIEILSDPETMRSIAKSVEDFRRTGKTYNIEEV
jgi:predicted CopG family antitoxin